MAYLPTKLLETGLRHKLRMAKLVTSAMRDYRTVFSVPMTIRQIDHLRSLNDPTLLVTDCIAMVQNVDTGAFFLTDDHIFGYPILPKQWVPTSFRMPMRVAERDSVPDGRVLTAVDLVNVFGGGGHQINSLDELVRHLNETGHVPDWEKTVDEDELNLHFDREIRFVCPSCRTTGFFSTLTFHESMGKNPESIYHGKGYVTGDRIGYCMAKQHVPGNVCGYEWKRDNELDAIHFIKDMRESLLAAI